MRRLVSSATLRYAPLASGTHDVPLLRRIVLEVALEHTVGIRPEHVEVTQIFGGITNQLFRCSFTGDRACLLLRVFGGEGMIDREVENATFEGLAAAGIGVPYHGRFANGRVEGWLAESEALELNAMPSVSTKVAGEMAKLHRFSLPRTEAGSDALVDANEKAAEPTMWPQLWSWLRQAQKQAHEIEARHGVEIAARFDALHAKFLGTPSRGESGGGGGGGEGERAWQLDRVEAELHALHASMPSSPAVFCHNDVLAGNVMLDQRTGRVTLIDFEYGGINHRGADIANHWNEWAGGTQAEMNGVCEYARFPSGDEQREFCAAYLGALSDRPRPDPDAVERLVAEANAFVQVNHWYWGLWAVNQAVLEGVAEFDYITYAESRAKRYWETKRA